MKAGQAELNLLKERYEQNVKTLEEIAKVDATKKRILPKTTSESKLPTKLKSQVVSIEKIETTQQISKDKIQLAVEAGDS